MVKFGQKLFFVTVCILLSACVTQNYDKDTPVIEQNSSKNELALTRVSLGLGYLKMGNTTQAKFNLEKAKKFAPNLVEVHTAFAHYYETVDEPGLTIQSYETALSIKNDDANTLNNYGVFLCRQEKYDAAEVQFLKAIAIPSYLLVSESYENLASCQLKAGNFDQAEFYLSKAITHSPNRGSAIFQMIRLEYAMGNYKKARSYTQKFEKVTRRFKPESLALAFKVYQQLGDRKTARNYGSMLVSMYPTSWEAKQYVLNGLERVDADDLADEYKLLTADTKKNKKRVIVLSPDNKNTMLPPDLDAEVSDNIADEAKVVAEVAVAPEQNKITTDTAIVAPQATDGIVAPVVDDTNTLTAGVVTGVEGTVIVAPAMKNESEFVSEDISSSLTTEKQMNNDTTAYSTIDDETLSEEATEKAVSEQLAITDELTDTVVKKEELLEENPYHENTIQENLDDEYYTQAYSDDNLASIITDPVNDVNTVDSNEALVSATELDKNIEEFVGNQSTDNTLTKDEERPFHIVAKGENLYGISLKYNIKLSALQRWNGMEKSTNINIGDTIYLEESLVAEGTDEQ